MGCTQTFDFLIVNCKSVIDEATGYCVSWADEGAYTCTKWADEGAYACSEWKDEGYEHCDSWADEGHKECSDWAEKHCHWYSPWNCVAGWICQAAYWVADWVCKAAHWVANLVCQGWFWVAKNVCKGFLWLAKWICKVFGWLLKTVCTIVGWFGKIACLIINWFTCAVTAVIKAIASLFVRSQKPAIEHVFVLMLENRSFDHILGLSPIQATDVTTGKVRDLDGVLGKGFSNIDPKTNQPVVLGGGAPFQLPGDDDDPPHEFPGVVTQIAGKDAVFEAGKPYPAPTMGGFVASYNTNIDNHPDTTSPASTTFACFDHDPDPAKSRLRVFATLAQEFCVCDRWFSSLPGPTWPNRFFALAATSGGLDTSPGKWDGIVSSTTVDGYRFENGNIFDRLDENCYDWEIFEGDEFPISFSMNGMNLNALRGKFTDMEHFKKRISKVDYKPKFVFIEPRYGEGDFSALGGFSDKYRCGNSMHPLNDVTRGEKLIKQVYEDLRASPLWEKSVLVITFDEHGGFADHVTPEAAVPPGDTETPAYVEYGFKFDRLGVRVPTLIVSPLIPRNVVDPTTYDHTSTLATLERLLGMKPLTNRDRRAADFLHLFSLKRPRADTPMTLPDPVESGILCQRDGDVTGEVQQSLEASRAFLTDERNRETVRLAARPATKMQEGFAFVALRRLALKQTPSETAAWQARYLAMESERDFSLFMVDAKLALRFAVRPPWLVAAGRGRGREEARPPKPTVRG